MAHIVICPYCHKSFDASIEPYVKLNRRYAHKTCFDAAAGASPYKSAKTKSKEKQIDPDLENLKKYISKLFGKKCNWAMTMKYIKKFKEENGYTYSGIQKSLMYFYEIKGNSIEKSNYSIGIVPYVYQDAYEYYYKIYMAQQKNATVKDYKAPVEVITIPSPRLRDTIKIKLFNMEDDDE